MAEFSDIDDGDSIDWNEAIAISQAAETARLEQSTAPPLAKQLLPTSTLADNFISPTDEEFLFLYDLIDTSQYILVNDDGQDIEDLGMKQSLRPAARTLFEQFRKKRGFLSVTDLTAPSGWCEVQYAYSLVGRRDLKPEKRPETIVTAAGNEIKVNKKLAVLHEKTLEKGRQVHAVLEREVHPEQVLVRTDSKVDRWGLRLLNQIVSLVTLRDAGKAREIPIFGFFNDVFVMGVMDEIEKRPLPETGDASSNKRIDSATNPTKKITDFFKTSTPIIRKPTHGYYLVDSKTRVMPYLPKKEYTVASRNQLMLYRYLFNNHATDSFDWNGLWTHIKLKPEDILSTSFLDQIKVICIGANLEDMLHLNTIGQLAEYLRDLHLEIGSLQDQLELVYRWRGSSHSKSQRARSRGGRNGTSPAGGVGTEPNDAALQAAIAASLKDQAGTAETPISLDDDVPTDTQALVDDSGMFMDDPAQEAVPAESALSLNTTQEISPPTINTGTSQATSANHMQESMQEISLPTIDAGSSQATSSSHVKESDKSPSSTPVDVWEIANKAEVISAQEEGSIIGTEKFQYNEEDMIEYVQNTLAFWNGREPKGVRLDETNKCRTFSVPVDKPFPQFDTTPTVPPNKDGDIDGSLVDEDDPGVVLVGSYIERLARQSPTKRIFFTGDEGPVYDEQVAVDILPDDYCIPENTTVHFVSHNCTNYRGVDFVEDGRNSNSRRSLEFGTNARAEPQIYRWRRGSVISISVQRNNKIVLMDLNAGIAGAQTAYVAVRSSEVTVAAMSRAYRLWNNANIGVRFAWTMDLGKSTYLTRTGGVKGSALATADYPAQLNGYQHLISAWDLMIELEWQAVGPNILAHELGHTLGIAHNDATDDFYELWRGSGDSVMGSTVDSTTNVITAIPPRDREGARILYNEMNPPITKGRTVAIFRAPQGPNPYPPLFPLKCRWTVFGICIYFF